MGSSISSPRSIPTMSAVRAKLRKRNGEKRDSY